MLTLYRTEIDRKEFCLKKTFSVMVGGYGVRILTQYVAYIIIQTSFHQSIFKI